MSVILNKSVTKIYHRDSALYLSMKTIEALPMENPESYSVEVPYKVKYTNKNPVPVAELVKSLQAYEKLLTRVAPFITEACDGAEIVDIQVYVTKVESGSILEDFLVKVVFRDKENYEKVLEVGADMLEANPVLTGAICLGVAAYIGFGIYNARVRNGDKEKTTKLHAHNGAIIQTGGTMNISEEAVKQILNQTKDKATLTKEVIDAISPAQLEDDASIEFADLPNVNIDTTLVKETPATYNPLKKNQDNETLVGVDVEVWASDKESNTRAWAGIVPGKVEKRINFILHDNLSPAQHHGKLRLKADIILTSELKPTKKEWEYTKVEIIKVYS